MHTKEQLEIMENFKNAVDTDIVEYIKCVYQGAKPTAITVGFLSDNAAKEIEKLTGKRYMEIVLSLIITESSI